MRTITKGPEPASLTQHRQTPNACYSNYADKQALREHLAKEQRGLCCYCLSRIRPVDGKMKVEHWHPQTAYPDEQLTYKNLLGVCQGSSGQGSGSQHCDASKGAQVLSRNPANSEHRVEEMVNFLSDGSIRSEDQTFDQDLNCILHLNLPFLKSNRKAVLDGFLKSLPRCGPLPRSELEGWLRRWNGDSHDGDLEPFCQVIIYWLRKKLAHS